MLGKKDYDNIQNALGLAAMRENMMLGQQDFFINFISIQFASEEKAQVAMQYIKSRGFDVLASPINGSIDIISVPSSAKLPTVEP